MKVVGAALILALGLNGCSVPKHPDRSPQPFPSALIVAPARFQPIITLDPVLKTKGGSLARGAADGALEGFGQAGRAGHPLAAAVLAIFMIPAGTIAGAIEGYASGAPKETVEHGRVAIEQTLSMISLQARLEKELLAELRAGSEGSAVSSNSDIGPMAPGETPDYRGLGAPFVLEVSVLEFGFGTVTREPVKKPYSMTLHAQARLIDTASNAVVDEMMHTYESDAHSAEDWLKNNAELSVLSLHEALSTTAQDIALELFRLYYSPASAKPKDDDQALVPYYVLRPLYPQPQKVFDWRSTTFRIIKIPQMDSLQPTFRWEGFPRAFDISAAGNQPHRFNRVTYEFVIYKTSKNKNGAEAAGPLLYARKGLVDPQHQIEEPLQPCEKYAWTVRTNFLLDGKLRSTEWTGAYNLGVADGETFWQSRRSLRSARRWEIKPSDRFLIFRAPPSPGGAECGN